MCNAYEIKLAIFNGTNAKIEDPTLLQHIVFHDNDKKNFQLKLELDLKIVPQTVNQNPETEYVHLENELRRKLTVVKNSEGDLNQGKVKLQTNCGQIHDTAVRDDQDPQNGRDVLADICRKLRDLDTSSNDLKKVVDKSDVQVLYDPDEAKKYGGMKVEDYLTNQLAELDERILECQCKHMIHREQLRRHSETIKEAGRQLRQAKLYGLSRELKSSKDLSSWSQEEMEQFERRYLRGAKSNTL